MDLVDAEDLVDLVDADAADLVMVLVLVPTGLL